MPLLDTTTELDIWTVAEEQLPVNAWNEVIFVSLTAEALTVAGLDSPSLTAVKGDKVEVEAGASEAVEGEEGTDPNLLQRSWMHSWMLTMPRYTFLLPEVLSVLYLTLFRFITRMFPSFSDGHQLEVIQESCSLFSLFYVINWLWWVRFYYTCIFIAFYEMDHIYSFLF